MIKELLATALLSGSLAAVSGGDITQDRWVKNTLIVNNLTISGDITLANKLDLQPQNASTYKTGGIVYNVHYTFTFDVHFTTTAPMYQNYITLKQLELYPSLVISTDSIEYNEYADNNYYYTFPSDYKIYALGIQDEAYSGFEHNNAFNFVATIENEWDDYGATGYLTYMGQQRLATLRNTADYDFYNYRNSYTYFNNKDDVKSNFERDFGVILDCADEWAMQISQNATGGSYQSGYNDGYADGINNTPNGVFSVVASAFNSVSSFLGIHIAPNITLGMLLSIPIVVAIVFVIIKFVKG